MTSRSAKRGTTLSMPAMVMSVSGRVRHMRPLPSLSTMQTPPVSAMRKFAPLTASLTRRNFSRRKRRAASARSGASPRSGRFISRGRDLADLLAILVQRGDDDVRGLVVPSWMMSSARSVS
jgi:hypothetical protein